MNSRTIILIWFILLLSSCNDHTDPGKKDSFELNGKESFIAPQVTVFASLPDSLQPKKILLSKAPIAKTVIVPGTHTIPHFKNENKKNLKDTTGISFITGEGGISHFTNYTSNEGLAIDRINCTLLDRSGNLWFGTGGGGVSKYDGQSFTNYTSAQGLVNNVVWSIIEDKMGNIWFGTRGGVSKYDGYIFTNFKTEHGLPNNNVLCMAEDQAGNLWFGTDRGGLSKYDGKSFTNFNKTNGLTNNNILCVYIEKKGNLLIGLADGGISKFDGNSFTNFSKSLGLPNKSVWCITEDRSNNLWFNSGDDGVSKYDGKSVTDFTTVNGLVKETIRSIIEDKKGNLWFGANGGGVSKYEVNSLHADKVRFTNFTTDQGLVNNSISSITEDKTGNIWFGTEVGVSRYEGKSFTNFTTTHGLTSNIVWSIAEDSKGNYWIGTGGGGVSRYDSKSFINYSTAQGLANNNVRSILKDKKGNLWFGTFGGISKFDGRSFTNFTTSQGLVSNIIRNITEDKEGNLWVAGNSGVSKFDGNSFTNFTTAQGLANNSVWNICEDRIGNIWFATESGISKYDGNSITNFTILQGVASNTIRSITEDKKGNLWFGTEGGGVSKYDGKSFTNFTTSDGLADDVAYDVVEDKEGNIIIGTNLGFTVLQASITSLPFSGIRKKIQYYNSKIGYPVKYINPNAMYLDSKGVLWAGTGGDKTGLVRFDYAELLKKKEKPIIGIRQILIKEEVVSWNSLIADSETKSKPDTLSTPAYILEEITIHGRKLNTEERLALKKKYKKVKFNDVTRLNPIPQNLVLPYKQNRITIDFGTDEISRPYLMEYQYILEGYDDEWSPVIKKTSATFGNIKEGDYVFKVIAHYTGITEEGADEWSEPAIFTFKILPPWYRSWWAYTSYGLILLILGLRLYFSLKERTIRKEREKTKERELEQAKEVEKVYIKLVEAHENLKSTQSQLIQSEKMASLGQLTAGIAHEIQNPLNFVNNFSEVSSELVNEMKNEMDKGNTDDAKTIAEDLKQNLEKINHHGKRAGDIVKGMLEHSRSSTGKKELTDINKLADEYLRLAYHGSRAKDKSFDATLKTEYDENVGTVNVISQDIGRVILNLITNAIYATSEKKKLVGDGYEPTVSVSTKKMDDKVLISVKDNGNGIPQKIVDKIFQPFFTTKPTGQGTGLGLSLSYDIVKAHGGEIEVKTKEAEGSDFIIKLPVN